MRKIHLRVSLRQKLKRFLANAISFKYIMKVHKVDEYQIYATSALREAKNSDNVISKVKNDLGI